MGIPAQGRCNMSMGHAPACLWNSLWGVCVQGSTFTTDGLQLLKRQQSWSHRTQKKIPTGHDDVEKCWDIEQRATIVAVLYPASNLGHHGTNSVGKTETNWIVFMNFYWQIDISKILNMVIMIAFFYSTSYLSWRLRIASQNKHPNGSLLNWWQWKQKVLHWKSKLGFGFVIHV